MTQFTEEEKTIRRIERRFSKGVVQYGLIEEGDKILIGLSGGKDSLALVELLGRRARIYKPRFSVVAVHVVMKNIPASSVHGTVGKPCSQLLRNTDAIKSLSVTIWMIFWKLY